MDRRIITIGDQQTGFVRQEMRLVEQAAQALGHRPVKAVAIIQIVAPLAVADQVGAADLDLDDRQMAPGIDRDQVGAAAVGQRHFAHREPVATTE